MSTHVLSCEETTTKQSASCDRISVETPIVLFIGIIIFLLLLFIPQTPLNDLNKDISINLSQNNQNQSNTLNTSYPSINNPITSNPTTNNPTTMIPTQNTNQPNSKQINLNNGFNFSQLVNSIQELEYSIYFTNISNITTHETNYSTGLAPHYYDGPFSLSLTCKEIRFRYMCPEYIIHKHQFDEFTFTMHNTNNFSSQTKQIQHMLQKRFNFYNYNIFQNLYHRLHTTNPKVFLRSNLRILMYGNSHMKQIIQGLLCTLMDISSDAVVNVIPLLTYCHPQQNHSKYNFNENFCFDMDMTGVVNTNNRNYNALHLNQSLLDEINQTQFVRPDICKCGDTELVIELINNVTIYFKMAHGENNKSIWRDVRNMKNKFEMKFDIIVFNTGNAPGYDFLNVLQIDLEKLNHTKKPIVFLRSWYEIAYRYLQYNGRTFWVDEEKVNTLREKYPNLVYVSSYRRYKPLANVIVNGRDLFALLKESPSYGHFCNPGIPEHYSMSLLHLIDVLTVINQV